MSVNEYKEYPRLLYGPNGRCKRVGDDAGRDYWIGQGWSLTPTPTMTMALPIPDDPASTDIPAEPAGDLPETPFTANPEAQRANEFLEAIQPPKRKRNR